MFSKYYAPPTGGAGILKTTLRLLANYWSELMVSVIIPVYNVISYLDRCMESVLKQTNKDFEVILINDGSTDGSDSKCIQWAREDNRIKYTSKKNEGPGPTRNLGVKIASGEYITFIDSDDYWDYEYLEHMLNAIKADNSDIAVCDILYVDAQTGGAAVSNIRIPTGTHYVKSDIHLIHKLRTFSCGKLYKKQLFTDNRIVQPRHIYEDIPSVPLLIAKAEKICRVDKPLYCYYRGREGSLVSDSNCARDMLLALSGLEDNFKAAELFETYYAALRRLSFGQIRFIQIKIKNCHKNDDISFNGITQALYDFADESYPNLKNYDKAVFAVAGHKRLLSAVLKIAYSEEQVIYFEDEKDFNIKADYLISEKPVNKNKLGLVNKKAVYVKDLEETYIGNPLSEDASWDLADLIFYML